MTSIRLFQPLVKSAHTVKSLALLLTLGTAGFAMAAIAPGGGQSLSGPYAKFNGNGELVFIAFDSTAKVSYTLDLGIDVESFFIGGQQDRGSQQFFVIDDPQWQNFLAAPDLTTSRLQWSVLGLDAVGGTVAGGVRLFQTIRQGDEAKVTDYSNQQFTNGTGSSQAGTFFNAVNASGTHGVAGVAPDFLANGSSVNFDPDPQNGYYGEGSVGLSPNLNNTAPYNMSNPIGSSSWFYMISRSGTAQLGKVVVDEFDNLGHDAYWGFTYVAPGTDSPYAGKYLLSYTMQSHAPTAATAAGLARMNFIDYAAGFASRPVDAPLGEFAGYQISSLVVASAVPEPSSWALLGLGLGLIGWRARRRG